LRPPLTQGELWLMPLCWVPQLVLKHATLLEWKRKLPLICNLFLFCLLELEWKRKLPLICNLFLFCLLESIIKENQIKTLSQGNSKNKLS
jgi:hypothetical protein